MKAVELPGKAIGSKAAAADAASPVTNSMPLTVKDFEGVKSVRGGVGGSAAERGGPHRGPPRAS